MVTSKPETTSTAAPAATTKPDANHNKIDATPKAKVEPKLVPEPVARMSTATLKAEMEKIDNEINSLAKNSLEKMGPGKPFSSATMHQIARHEVKKQRLLIHRLAALLRKDHPEARSIVDKLLSIEI
ncbi:hypothetical protein [Comamonas thiooxydans]|uniref:hypothetical protein n=1 Tax=Comamonas thiooxydans TaxID=363952 RepID=UPI001CCB0282|nr:hypothetical protein [Comamonas thiooxydans]UBQ44504.1 hypothetical protein LCH15_25135 [Comamonas thiooxydans]